jgi:hypothetical protein
VDTCTKNACSDDIKKKSQDFPSGLLFLFGEWYTTKRRNPLPFFMLHTKNKKKFSFVSIFFIVVSLTIASSFFVVENTFAADPAPAAAPATTATPAAQGDPAVSSKTPNVDAAGLAGAANEEVVGDGIFQNVFKLLLYSLGVFLAKLIIVAATVFAWATKPEYISGPTGLLNLEVVYELWKFIRDFFNLTFIFLLLFSAFGTVFQVSKFNLKKNFLAIIFAAVAINFSFPITRLVIDAGNVPMYFFAKGIVGTNGGNALSDVPRALTTSSGLGDIIGGNGYSESSSIPDLLKFVVFNFIFMVTLFMLALMFVIRLITLVILLIFSPMGIAASIVPGLSSYGKKWWDNLLTNVFFGPAAMLMLVISLKFTLAIKDSAFVEGAGAEAAANSINAASQVSLVSQGVFFIPIILMFYAMQTGKKMGAVGASEVTKYGDKAVDWAKKQAMKPGKMAWGGVKKVGGAAAAPVTDRYKGAKAGLTDRFAKMPYVGSKALKERSEKREALAKGFTSGGMDGRKRALAELRDKQAREQEKKWKEEGKTKSDIIEKLEKGTEVEKLAAASFLANEKEAIKNPGVLATALAVATATGKKDLYDKILQGATEDALVLNPEQMDKIVNSEVAARVKKEFKAKPEKTAAENETARKEMEEEFTKDVEGGLSYKLKKEGKLKYFLDYKIDAEVERQVSVSNGSLTKADILNDTATMESIQDAVYAEKAGGSAKAIAKQKDLLKDINFQRYVNGKWSNSEKNTIAKFVMEDGDTKLVETVEAIQTKEDISGVTGGDKTASAPVVEQRSANKAARDARAQAFRENKPKSR